jgi:hypothetical protein
MYLIDWLESGTEWRYLLDYLLAEWSEFMCCSLDKTFNVKVCTTAGSRQRRTKEEHEKPALRKRKNRMTSLEVM